MPIYCHAFACSDIRYISDAKGTILHEMMHNLGVSHEHNRPDRWHVDFFPDNNWISSQMTIGFVTFQQVYFSDRDTVITMDWSNLVLDKSYNFFKAKWATDTTDKPK